MGAGAGVAGGEAGTTPGVDGTSPGGGGKREEGVISKLVTTLMGRATRIKLESDTSKTYGKPAAATSRQPGA